MTDEASRICTTPDETATAYWTRSPNVSGKSYWWQIAEDGSTFGYTYPSEAAGVRTMFCI